MSSISMFYGIIIRMPDNPRADASPYFTASYTDFEAQVDIERAEVVTGNLPDKQTHMVEAWGEIHRDELLANWTLMKEHEEPYRIEPLQ